MGYGLIYKCRCGFDSKFEHVSSGYGFTNELVFNDTLNTYVGTQTEPAYCSDCSLILDRNIYKKYCKCSNCKKKVRFYFNDLNLDKDDLYSDYLINENGGEYHQGAPIKHFCPACKQKELKFEIFILWD